MVRYSEFEKICKDLNLRICGNYIFTDEKYTHDITIGGVLANTDTECIGHIFSEEYRYKHQNIKPSPNEIEFINLTMNLVLDVHSFSVKFLEDSRTNTMSEKREKAGIAHDT